jgi:hypothetical protein
MATDNQLSFIYHLFNQLGITSVSLALEERGFKHVTMLEDLDFDEASQLIDQLIEERDGHRGERYP